MLFFAISGILICSRLLEEDRLHGSISLKIFYIRRLFRIQPAAFLYLAVAGILSLIGLLPQMFAPWLSSLLCFRNFYEAANWISSPDDRYTVHFWSLAVEEHFYLFLPLILVIAKNRVAQILGALSVLFFFWPPIADHMGFATTPLAGWRTDMALRYLLVPAFMAVLLTRPAIRSWFIKVSSNGKLIFLTVAGILISQRYLDGHGTNEICCIGFHLAVLSTMFHPGTWLGRLLETRLFMFMGKISYSLYLWHVLFFIRRPEASSLRFLQSAPWNVIAAIVCAVLSYYLVEKPLIRIGHRLAPPATPGRPDLQRA
jgi:peptidoglycan/LPS O-acetylase OafA/YrhL